MEKLDAQEIERALEEHPGWHLSGEKIVREWTFEDFRAAMAFVNRVADAAEEAAHHPDINIRYNRVLLGLVTHDAGGITASDVKMVDSFDTLFGMR